MISNKRGAEVSIETFRVGWLRMIGCRRYVFDAQVKAKMLEFTRHETLGVIGHYDLWDRKAGKNVSLECLDGGLRRGFPQGYHPHKLSEGVHTHKNNSVPVFTTWKFPHMIYENFLHRSLRDFRG